MVTRLQISTSKLIICRLNPVIQDDGNVVCRNVIVLDTEAIILEARSELLISTTLTGIYNLD